MNWPEHNASPGAVGASALPDPGPPEGGTDGRPDGRSPGHRVRQRKANLAAVGEARTEACFRQAKEPREGCIWVMRTNAHSDVTVATAGDRLTPARDSICRLRHTRPGGISRA